MKLVVYCSSLILLAGCSSAPKPNIDLRPQPAFSTAANSTIRYPEVVHAYHFGRYIDPNDSLVMHEQHVVYRVEETSRWDLYPGAFGGTTSFSPRDATFSPAPVNDAILAEVNSQRLATSQIMAQSKLLASTLQQLERALQSAKSNQEMTFHLQVNVDSLKKRLATLEAAQAQAPTNMQTNAPTNPNP